MLFSERQELVLEVMIAPESDDLQDPRMAEIVKDVEDKRKDVERRHEYIMIAYMYMYIRR